MPVDPLRDQLAFAIARSLSQFAAMQEYTRSQLALRNGQDRDEIWIAYQGVIYDATPSRYWRTGIHYGHWAGQDLSEELADAPHSEQVFQRLQVIGRLSS